MVEGEEEGVKEGKGVEGKRRKRKRGDGGKKKERKRKRRGKGKGGEREGKMRRKKDVCMHHIHVTTLIFLNGCYETSLRYTLHMVITAETSATVAMFDLAVFLMTHRGVEDIDSLHCRLSCLFVPKHQIYPLMEVLRYILTLQSL